MKKILIVFGTRPEAIKMCPLIKELKNRSFFEVVVCTTGQHIQMLEQILKCFNVVPNYNLKIMQDTQTLFDITNNIVSKFKPVLEKERPDIVLVHGDTTTTFVASLCCYYLKIPVGHVEAGLRTYDIYSPYPEEFNRQAVGIIAKYNFAPTEKSKQNLINEGKIESSIFITGNTAIDALLTTIKENYTHPLLDWTKNSRLIIITAHRRENIGMSLRNIFKAIKKILIEYPKVKAIYPVHRNPLVRDVADEILGTTNNIKLIEPLDVIDFHNFLAKSYLILTDSGGIQEEAPHLGKPVLVTRNTTERPEGISSGTLKLVGTNEDIIYNNIKLLLDNKEEYHKMSIATNPYGDGMASIKIANILEKELL